jgi:tetratricopeptide (TPR) repeat protein
MRFLPALLLAGCWPASHPAPEEVALDRYEVAEKHFAAGKYAEAAPEYEFVVRHRNRWKDPYLKLSRCHEALGRRDEAIRILERLLAFDRDDEQGLREIARLRKS